MNSKTLWGTVSGLLAAISLAVAHNIDAILAHPMVAVSVVLTALSGWLFGHQAGVNKTAQYFQPPSPPPIKKSP